MTLPMSDFDLDRLAERLRRAAERARGLTVTVSNTDLMFSKDGYGTCLSESIPFPALFLRDEDVLDRALTRLGCAPNSSDGSAEDALPGPVVSPADAPSMSTWPRDIAIQEGEIK